MSVSHKQGESKFSSFLNDVRTGVRMCVDSQRGALIGTSG